MWLVTGMVSTMWRLGPFTSCLVYLPMKPLIDVVILSVSSIMIHFESHPVHNTAFRRDGRLCVTMRGEAK